MKGFFGCSVLFFRSFELKRRLSYGVLVQRQFYSETLDRVPPEARIDPLLPSQYTHTNTQTHTQPTHLPSPDDHFLLLLQSWLTCSHSRAAPLGSGGLLASAMFQEGVPRTCSPEVRSPAPCLLQCPTAWRRRKSQRVSRGVGWWAGGLDG